jgi:ClpP class serine protease
MAVQSSGGIAVLPLYGVVTQRGNMVEDVSGPGSTSTQQFSAALHQLLADDTVGQILIDIDSPGGSVYGVSELADEIQAARSQKPVVAVANSLAASAAYWIGCSAGEFYVSLAGSG